MRVALLLSLLTGCAWADMHVAAVRFRDPHAVRLSTRAPDGTVAELPADPQAHTVAAGGGIFRADNADTRAAFTVHATRELDGTSVLGWSTGMALTTGDEIELVHADGRLAELQAPPDAFITPHAVRPTEFYAHVCVALERRSARGFAGYSLATVPNGGPTAGCMNGVAVDVRTPWSNVFEVRDRVTTLGPLFGALMLIHGLPLLIAGAALTPNPDSRAIGVPFLVVGALVAGLSIPGFVHVSHDDVTYPQP